MSCSINTAGPNGYGKEAACPANTLFPLMPKCQSGPLQRLGFQLNPMRIWTAKHYYYFLVIKYSQSFVSLRRMALCVYLPLSLLNPYIQANWGTYPFFFLTKSDSCMLRASFRHNKRSIAQRSGVAFGAHRVSPHLFPAHSFKGIYLAALRKEKEEEHP